MSSDQWIITVGPQGKTEIEGDRLSKDGDGGLWLDDFTGPRKIATIRGDGVDLIVPFADVDDVYLGRDKGAIRIGNCPVNVSPPSEPLEIKKPALQAHIAHGHPWLQPNAIGNAKMLMGGFNYRISNDDAVCSGERFTTDSSGDINDVILDAYRQAIGEAEVHLLMSGGFDSRFELAAVAAAIGDGWADRVTLHHINFGNFEASVAHEVAAKSRVRLIEYSPAELGRTASRSRWSEPLQSLAPCTYRVSLYNYLPLLTNLRQLNPSAALLGYSLHTIKGRNYDLLNAPRSDWWTTWRILTDKVMASGEALGLTHGEVQVEAEEREYFESIHAEVAKVADGSQLIDILNFQLQESNFLMHRLRVIRRSLGIYSPLLDESVVRTFQKMPSDAKAGTGFQLEFIEAFAPQLLSVPLLSSTGSGVVGITRSSRVRNVLQHPTELRRVVTNRLGRKMPPPKPPAWWCSTGDLAQVGEVDPNNDVLKTLTAAFARSSGEHQVYVAQAISYLETVANHRQIVFSER